ncbi:MAG TPA: FAD-dependent oxidoreductase [Gaiellaceae bacterium]|nr:FAD-dependent oxidoreductase [Gaiellaceae bacterium]
MARTPLASLLQAAAAEEPAYTRAELLKHAGIAGVALAGLGRLAPTAEGATAPSIAIVGAGLAGLSAAYSLKRGGLASDLYEASDRVGGRCWTLRGTFADGQISEHGGELIDQGHTQVRQLAQALGLDLDNLAAAEVNSTEMLGYFDGAPYTFDQATQDLKAVWQKLHSDVSAASYPTLWNLSTERGRQLDAMSVVDWINESVPGGITSRLGQLLDVAYNIEYGAESKDQSSLNLIYLLGYQGPGQMRIFGKSNEKYHVRGGNDQIAQRLADAVGRDRISLATELVAIAKNGTGFDLWFSKGGSTYKRTYDRVVLALPFSILRSSVDYSKAGFEQRKVRAIQQLGMGTNSKLHVQFTERWWDTLDCNGETYSDRGYQNTWEVSRAQAGTSGILVNYTGGKIGATFGSGTPSSRAQQFLAQIEPVLPGLSARWNGKAAIDFWPGYRWTKGSYSYWKVGQYTAFAGMERARQGNCHFAGEHTSIDFQGYLNGAVESGQRAAGEILADLK